MSAPAAGGAPSGPRTGPDAPPVAPRVAPSSGRTVAAAGARGSAPASARAAAPQVEEDVPVPTPTPVPATRTRSAAYAQELADKYATQEFQLRPGTPPKKKVKRGTLATTVALFVVLAVALGGWASSARARKERIEAIDRLLKETLPLVEKDAHAGYVEAANEARSRSSTATTASIAGHASSPTSTRSARGEHGDGDAVRAEAVKHVEAARQLGQRHSHLVAAEAYLKLHGGDAAGAKEVAEARSSRAATARRARSCRASSARSLLREGDLDGARDMLGKAQKASPGDVRIAYLLARAVPPPRRGVRAPGDRASTTTRCASRRTTCGRSSARPRCSSRAVRWRRREGARELVLAPQAGASKPAAGARARDPRRRCSRRRARAREAAAAEAEAAKLDPASPEIPHLVGLRKLREGDAAGAVEALQRAVSIDPRRVSLYADLVRAQLAREGGAQQAIETVKRAVARVGESPRLALLLGDAYRAAGDADLARGQYEKAIQLGRPFPDARVALARLHRAKNNIPGALVELDAGDRRVRAGRRRRRGRRVRGDGGGGAGARREARGRSTTSTRRRSSATRRAATRSGARASSRPTAAGARTTAKRGSSAYAKLCPRGPHAAARRRGSRAGRSSGADPRPSSSALRARRLRERAPAADRGRSAGRPFAGVAASASRFFTSRSIASIGFPVTRCGFPSAVRASTTVTATSARAPSTSTMAVDVPAPTAQSCPRAVAAATPSSAQRVTRRARAPARPRRRTPRPASATGARLVLHAELDRGRASPRRAPPLAR